LDLSEELLIAVVFYVLFLSFILLPPLLYTGMKKIRDPVPFWVPALMTSVAFVASRVMHPESGTPIGKILLFLLVLLLNGLVVFVPFPLFAKEIDQWRHGLVLFFAGFVALVCEASAVFAQVDWMNGQPWTHLNTRLPILVGDVMDTVITAFNAETMVYAYESKVYTTLVSAGLYLEISLVSGVLFGAICLIFPREKPFKGLIGAFSWFRQRYQAQDPAGKKNEE
jgi:hypothetical protein